MPMPAITACLIVSLLGISIAMRGSTWCSWKKRSISARVPRGRLAHDQRVLGELGGGDGVEPQDRWPGGATKTWGARQRLRARGHLLWAAGP